MRTFRHDYYYLEIDGRDHYAGRATSLTVYAVKVGWSDWKPPADARTITRRQLEALVGRGGVERARANGEIGFHSSEVDWDALHALERAA